MSYKLSDLPISSSNSNSKMVFGDSSGTLYQTTKQEFLADITGSGGGTVNTGSLLLTSSFNSFSSSYYTDSASFDFRIANVTGSGGVSGSSYVLTSSFNPFSSSYHSDSASFDSRIGTLSGSNTSLPKASDLGILTNGSDQTSALNTILSNSNYKGILMDFKGGGAVTITGSVNAQNKVISFVPGTYFTDSGSISNAVIDPGHGGYTSKLFDISVQISSSITSTDRFSVKWFGAAGTGTGNDLPALQASSDTVIGNSNMTHELYIPPGSYIINSPWMLYKWSGTAYAQWSINIRGDWKAANSNLVGYPRIIATFSDGPAIGVQKATAGSITGISVEGPFTFSGTYDTFINTTWESVSGSMRDTISSPSAGIAIDPVRNGPTKPEDGGYPPLNGSVSGSLDWYRGTSATGGTTDFLISDCKVLGFTVDIINSPNGNTQQGEDCIIQNCHLDLCKVAIVYCQSQSDNTVIRNCRSWNFVWTVIDTKSYGSALLGRIEGYNVAGTVNTLFNIQTQKPFTISNFYAESFFSIGILRSAAGGSSLEGIFHFGNSVYTPQYHFDLMNIRVHDSVIRYYDDNFNKRARGATMQNCIFENVYFDLPPFTIGQYDKQLSTVTYHNCLTNGGVYVLGQKNDMYTMLSSNNAQVLYGKFKLQDGATLDQNSNSPQLTLSYDCTTFDRFIGGIASANINPGTNRSASIAITSGYENCVRINDIVFEDATRKVLGRISDISGSNITISEIPTNIVSASYVIDAAYYLTNNNNFVGDITNGSPIVTNVVPLFPPGFVNPLNTGSRIDHKAFQNGTFIKSYSSSINTITLSNNSSITAIKQNFFNGSPVVEIEAKFAPDTSTYNTYTRGIPTGASWKQLLTSYVPAIYKFTKGGFLSSSLSGSQSEFSIDPPTRFSGSNYQYYNFTSGSWVTLN